MKVVSATFNASMALGHQSLVTFMCYAVIKRVCHIQEGTAYLPCLIYTVGVLPLKLWLLQGQEVVFTSWEAQCLASQC
jgi:hypothetical protein